MSPIMATVKKHISFFWGALDINTASTQNPYYAVTDYATLGASAVAGSGVGVRRATLVCKRPVSPIADDDFNLHFDFLNLTGDEPDDTWTTADYVALESRLQTWWSAAAVAVPSNNQFYRVMWHRVGKGIAKPNPAIRILDLGAGLNGLLAPASVNVPPQVASAISLRHGSRPSWGRTYLPYGKSTPLGRIGVTDVDTMCTATMALLTGAKSDDFLMVVTSVRHDQAFVVDSIAVDDTPDIQRSRRWKHLNYRKTLVAP